MCGLVRCICAKEMSSKLSPEMQGNYSEKDYYLFSLKAHYNAELAALEMLGPILL